MSRGHVIDLRATPLALYLGQIERHREDHHPLIDDTVSSGVRRSLADPNTARQRTRQTELLLAARRHNPCTTLPARAA